jgi:hypothetical protein
MVQFNVPPSPTTYSLLLQICLKGQSDRALEYNLPDPSAFEEGTVAHEELLVERRYISEMTWLEKRRKLLWQGPDPTRMDKPERGAWFGSAEFEIAWGFYLDAEARGITIPRQGLDALVKVSPARRSTSSQSALLTASAYVVVLAALTYSPFPYLPRHASADSLIDLSYRAIPRAGPSSVHLHPTSLQLSDRRACGRRPDPLALR